MRRGFQSSENHAGILLTRQNKEKIKKIAKTFCALKKTSYLCNAKPKRLRSSVGRATDS